MLGMQPVEQAFGEDVKATCKPLPFASAQPLIPEVGEIISLALTDLAPAIATGSLKLDASLIKMLPVLFPTMRVLFAYLGVGGRLERLAPKILANTFVVMPDAKGELETYEMKNEKDRNRVFDTHPEIYFPLLIMAGQVTFTRFFPAASTTSDPPAGETPAE